MKKIHYAWVIMIACAITQIGVLGTMVYPIGLFYGMISADFGIGIGSVAVSQTILAFAIALFSPLAGKVLAEKKINIVMSLAAIGMTVSFAILPLLRSIYLWYALYVFIGFCASFITFLHTPLLINNWFHKSSGLALGIATGSGAVGGAFFTSFVGPKLIDSFGWESAFVGLAIIGAILIVLPSFFLIRFKPADKGLVPYGYEEKDGEDGASPSKDTLDTGITYDEAKKTPSYLLMIIALIGLSTAAVYSTHLVQVAVRYGHAPSLGPKLASLAMLGTLITRLVIGGIKDKIGPFKSLVGCVLLVIVNMFALAFLYNHQGVLQVEAFISGLGATTGGFTSAWMTRMLFGSKDYGRIIGRATMFYNIPLGLYTSAVGYIADGTGSYQLAFIISGIAAIVSLLSIITSYKKRPEFTS